MSQCTGILGKLFGHKPKKELTPASKWLIAELPFLPELAKYELICKRCGSKIETKDKDNVNFR